MISENFIYLSVAISLVSIIPYLAGILKGKVKPNRATWFILSIAPMLAFAAEIKSGVGLRSLVTFMSGFVPFSIFITSFVNKDSYWRLTKSDYIYGSLSVIGLFLWWILGEGNIAIIFAIFADAMAFYPTLKKAYEYPDTENPSPFIGGLISASIGLLILKSWNFADWAFPTYLLVANLLMISFTAVKPKLAGKDPNAHNHE